VRIQRIVLDSPVARLTARGAVVAAREMTAVVMAQPAVRRRDAN
jgi:hypothetical protein